MALDGSLLQVVGVTIVKFACTDGAVILPSIEVSAYVVGSLSVVSVDVVIGNDVVTGSGGMTRLSARGHLSQWRPKSLISRKNAFPW